MDKLVEYIRGDSASFLSSMISSMEDRYGNVDPNDPVYDINMLTVVKNNARFTRSRARVLRSFSDSSLGYHSGNSLSDRSKNIMCDQAKQSTYLKQILTSLKTNPSHPKSQEIAASMKKRCVDLLRSSPLPRNPNLRPIFIFYDENDFVPTFICDIDKYTPWTYYCNEFFGPENMALSQEIYEIISGEVLVPNYNSRPSIMFTTSTPLCNRTNVSKVVSYQQVMNSVRYSLPIGIFTNFYHYFFQSSSPTNPSTDKNIPLKDQYRTSYRRNKPDPESPVLDCKHQLHCAKVTLETLNKNDNEAKEVIRLFRQRAAVVLQSKSFPDGKDIHPFFHFHESGELSISFLYDNHEYSPWSAILHACFGPEILNLYHIIYKKMMAAPDAVAAINQAKMMLNNTMPMTDTEKKKDSNELKRAVRQKQTCIIEEVFGPTSSKKTRSIKNKKTDKTKDGKNPKKSRHE